MFTDPRTSHWELQAEEKVLRVGLGRSQEALCERSLHYFKPHRVSGKSYQKNGIQGRRAKRVWACCFQDPRFWRLPGTEWRPLGATSLRQQLKKLKKKKKERKKEKKRKKKETQREK